jgi:hypothetical protein
MAITDFIAAPVIAAFWPSQSWAQKVNKTSLRFTCGLDIFNLPPIRAQLIEYGKD